MASAFCSSVRAGVGVQWTMQWRWWKWTLQQHEQEVFGGNCVIYGLVLAAETSPFHLKSLFVFIGQSCPCSGSSYIHGIWIFGATESLLPLSFCSTEAFFFASGSVFEEYIFLVLDASGSSPLIPGEGVVELNDVDNKLVRESVLENVECGFFVEGISCFVCKALELSNVVIEVFLLHLEFSELPLGSGFNSSVGVRIGESIED